MKIILFLSFILLSSVTYSQIVINEIQPANSGIIADNMGDFDDWIELINSGNEIMDIGGLVLKDGLDTWRIPENDTNTILGPGEYFLLWADDEVTEGLFHTNFKLSASNGEYVGLFQSDSTTLVDEINFPPITGGYSYARCGTDHNEWLILGEPSPLAENKCYSVSIKTPDNPFEIIVYKSFSEEKINIQIKPFINDQYLIKLIDIMGIVRYSELSSNENIFTINIQDLNNGYYFLVVSSAKEKEIKKIQIR